MATSQRFDVIVLGVGGMGSAAVYHLARRGRRVLGLERFSIPHEQGSSHGITRIIRLAYYEHPSYVPLLQRAYALWEELQQSVGEQLLHTTGSIDAGPPNSFVFEGSRQSCLQHDLPHEILNSTQLSRRFPGYRLPPDTVAVYQPRGGFLLPERCIVGHVMLAQALGAEVHYHEQVLEWQPRANGVVVQTDRAEYEAEKLVITAGPWASGIVDCLAGLTVVERQVLAWFQPRQPNLFAPSRFPVFNVHVEEGHYYGFPVFSVPGFKIGRYNHLAEQSDPDRIDRAIHSRDEEVLRGFAERYFPDGAGPSLAYKTCMFTNSPDGHFIIDRHPEFPQVSFAAGFSGHGFKFSSIIGEIMADLATDGTTRHDIDFLRLDRFA